MPKPNMLVSLIEFLEKQPYVTKPFVMDEVFPRPITKSNVKLRPEQVRSLAARDRDCAVPMRAFLTELGRLGYVNVVPSTSRGNSWQYVPSEDLLEFLKERHVVVLSRSVATSDSSG